jgi:UDP-3-O-[3-hydroxymyristoyl] glucosamine N-acyltransferase
MAGKAGVADKVEIGDGAIAGPMSGISKDIKPGETVMGSLPAKPKREWWRLMALVDRLPELFERIKKLESRQQ